MSPTIYVVAAYAVVAVVFGSWAGIMLRRSARRARELSELDDH